MPAPRLAIWSILVGVLASPLIVHKAEARVLRDVDIPSATLGQPIPCAVILPDGYDQDPDRRYPVLLLLHGTDGGHHDWLDAGGLADDMGAVPFNVAPAAPATAGTSAANPARAPGRPP